MQEVEEIICRKMRAKHLSEAAIGAFLHGVRELLLQNDMIVREADIAPVPELPQWDALVSTTAPAGADLLGQIAIIKLNGGLGTSMGLQQAKSLLQIKPDLTFLDMIVRQTETVRRAAGRAVPLLLMNSFSTSADTLKYLRKYAVQGYARAEETELMQNMVPKLLCDTLLPVCMPGREALEWCPPGHGDLYAALVGSGRLGYLLARGIRYAFVSNSDNLGALPDVHFLRWFAQSDAPFVMEVTVRTEADRKGGHLAVRRRDGQLMLREVAQCSAEDMPAFRDVARHRFFNTNNLWIRLDALRDYLTQHGGVIPLPVIRNVKTADPRDPGSPAVYQLETAMGAALQCFPGAQAVCVPRSRFFPVKTTGDLLLLRSDAVEMSDDGHVELSPECNGVAPVVRLEGDLYKLAESLETLGVPSLKHVRSLTVRSLHRFTAGEPLEGDIEI